MRKLEACWRFVSFRVADAHERGVRIGFGRVGEMGIFCASEPASQRKEAPHGPCCRLKRPTKRATHPENEMPAQWQNLLKSHKGCQKIKMSPARAQEPRAGDDGCVQPLKLCAVFFISVFLNVVLVWIRIMENQKHKQRKPSRKDIAKFFSFLVEVLPRV